MSDPLEALEGKTLKFYGVCNEQFKLDGIVYKAIEDPSDGYRSYLESVVVADVEKGIFFKRSVAEVLCTAVDTGPFSGWVFTEEATRHVWLRVGTSNNDDYYPLFTFDYTPLRSP